MSSRFQCVAELLLQFFVVVRNKKTRELCSCLLDNVGLTLGPVRKRVFEVGIDRVEEIIRILAHVTEIVHAEGDIDTLGQLEYRLEYVNPSIDYGSEFRLILEFKLLSFFYVCLQQSAANTLALYLVKMRVHHLQVERPVWEQQFILQPQRGKE